MTTTEYQLDLTRMDLTKLFCIVRLRIVKSLTLQEFVESECDYGWSAHQCQADPVVFLLFRYQKMTEVLQGEE